MYLLLAETSIALSSIEVLISNALINLDFSDDESVLINNVLKECNDMKEPTKHLKTERVHWRLQSVYKATLLYCLKLEKIQEIKKPKGWKDKKCKTVWFSVVKTQHLLKSKKLVE